MALFIVMLLNLQNNLVVESRNNLPPRDLIYFQSTVTAHSLFKITNRSGNENLCVVKDFEFNSRPKGGGGQH